MDFKSNTMEYQTSSKFDPFAPICMEKGIVKIHVDEFKTNSSNQSTVEFNIEADPKERVDIAPTGAAWTLAMYTRLIQEYYATLKDHPNPPAPNLTKF